MNKLFNLFTATTIFALVIFISCGGDGGDNPDPDPDPIADQLAVLLNGGQAFTATAGGVKQDGIAAGEWDSFAITFTGSGSSGSFTTTGRPSSTDVPNVDVVWPASGTWAFADAATAGEKDVSKVVRKPDDVTINLSVTSTKISLTFLIEEAGAGRTQGVTGTWVFEFPI